MSDRTLIEQQLVLSPESVDFQREIIYFIVIDRFNDGNPTCPRGEDELNDPQERDWDKYWGGDLQGILDKLDYLQESGFTALWLTPLFEQVEGKEEGTERAPIHGYWARDFKRFNARWLNPHEERSIASDEETVFDRLLKAMHERGMKLILDIVCNHSSPNTDDGKGKLYDDGRLIADFDNDYAHWYHHYGKVTDWEDEWQVQNREVGGLATFNENNIQFRQYIKEAVRLWLSRGADALRIDTVKHMPLWFWQEFTNDMRSYRPGLFIFGEWINGHPEDKRFMQYANDSGMSLLDFALCEAIRKCLAEGEKEGFKLVQEILSQDVKYHSAGELMTFIDNHDMPRFLSLNADRGRFHMALILLLTLRGVPCVYYGSEQYLHCDIKEGNDPYNRPMMESWEMTEARRLIAIFSEERKMNEAISMGGVWPKQVEEDVYVFERRYKTAYCLVALNRGKARRVEVGGLKVADGTHHCILSGRPMEIQNETLVLEMKELEACVISKRAEAAPEPDHRVYFQISGVPANPGERIAVIGDCAELGEWDLEKAVILQCINPNTWMGEVNFTHSTDRPVAYKYAIFNLLNFEHALREERLPRRRVAPQTGSMRWRDVWER